MRKFVKENYLLLIAVFCLVISRIPCVFFELHGINFDEAAIDYNIFCLSEFGTDRYGNPFPVYFANGPSGQSALYVYIGVILTKIFGFSVTIGRVVKLLIEIVTLVFGGLLIRDIWDRRTEWIFYGLYIISPYFYKMTGMAYDCDMIIPVFVLCMYFANRCKKNKKLTGYIGTGICLGLLSYSYVIAVFMIPLFILVQFFNGWNRKHLIAEVLIAFLVSFPMFWYLLCLVGVAPAIETDFITIASVSGYRKSDFGFEFDNLANLRFLFVTDTQSDFAGSRTFGTIYQISIPFIIVGVVKLIRNIKDNEEWRSFGCFFLVAFIPLLFIKDATTYNFTILYYFLIVFVAIGINLLIDNFKTLSIAIAVAYVVMFGIFIKEYLVREPYIYGDNRIMQVLSEIDPDEKVMLDTTGVFQAECYIGIKYKVSPDNIVYNEYGRGTSINNIYFNSTSDFEIYDKILIRDEVCYVYETTREGGLNITEARALSEKLQKSGYDLRVQNGYYIYLKGERHNE